MKTIYLVRHAQSEYNEKGIFQGKLDSDLTPNGYIQARFTGKFFENKKIDIIFSSPQKRALKTAYSISDIIDRPIIIDERIRELSFGIFEGKKFFDMLIEHKDLMEKWLLDPIENSLPTQEPTESFKERIESFLNHIINIDQKNIIVVSHGGFLHGFLCTILGIPLNKLWNFHTDNTGISKIFFDGVSFSIKYLNDTSHLK